MMADPAFGLDILTKRTISHDEAREAMQRLVNSHFRQEPHARASIPARPDYDDDLVLSAYIEQQRAKDGETRQPSAAAAAEAASSGRA